MTHFEPDQIREVQLRDVNRDDLIIFFRHQLDPEACRMAGFPSRDRDAFMAHWGKILANETIVKKAVLFDGHVAGNIASFFQGGRRQVGYWFGKEFWGKSIAVKALALFLEQLDERPLYAYVVKTNHASIRVLEKCGFRRSVVEGDEYLYLLG